MLANYAQLEYFLAQVQLVLFTMGMGATLTASDFIRIVKQPRYLLVGAACLFFLGPVLAVLISRWFRLEPGIAVGLFLIAALPGGALSKVFTYLGKGEPALSISMTACGTLGAVATVPLVLRLLASEYVGEAFEIPAVRIVTDVALYLLLPLFIGMGVGRFFPKQRKSFSKVCVRVGFVFVVVLVTMSLGTGRIRPGERGWIVPLAIITFCVASQQLSMLPFRLLGWPRADCLSVGVEMTMRNMNLALLLKASLFHEAAKGVDPVADGVLFVILFYAATAWIAGGLLALNFRRRAKREAAGKEELEAVASR